MSAKADFDRVADRLAIFGIRCYAPSGLVLLGPGNAADADIDGAGSSNDESGEETKCGGQGSYKNPYLSSTGAVIVNHMLDANGAIDYGPSQEKRANRSRA